MVRVTDAYDAIRRRHVTVARLDESAGAREERHLGKKTRVFPGERIAQVNRVRP
ncbi:hypothetical protein [Streptomyces siamensis]|uniref:Uncharacterized protein n=1 Tax=Streptomyces siamensis TaxID=1274986 RepID=A0ABP9JIM4_9ACTN